MTSRTPHTKLSAAIFVAVIALVAAAPAEAVIPDDGGGSTTLDTGLYTHNRCPIDPPRSRVDPINVVFYNWGTWDRVVRSLEYHAGWKNEDGSTQYFTDSRGCFDMNAQRASGSVSSSRFHLRLHQVPQDRMLGYLSVGDAHHEDFVTGFSGCWDNGGFGGHAVDSNGPEGSGFDRGRQELRQRMAAGGHTWYREWWGNTQNFKQCDGDYARSDGYTVYVSHHQAYH
jgi:hypothetical protein